MFSLLRPVSLCRQGYRLRSLHYSAALLAKQKSLKTFHLADIGEGITECEVLKWSVQPQSKVSSFDPLCEVQSDKASVEITSPFDGVVTQILVQEGHIAKVGEGLCVIEVEEDGESSAGAPKEEPSITVTPKSEETASPKATEGSYTPPSATRRHHPMDPDRPAGALAQNQQRSLPEKSSSNQALATPSVRHYARSQGITDLDVIGTGSGRGGRIERADVDAFLSRSKKESAGSTAGARTERKETGEEVVIEMGRTRWGMWKSMTKSLDIPLFGYSATLDLTALNDMLPILNAHIPAEYKPAPPPPEHAPSISPDSIFSGTPSANTLSSSSSDPATHFKRMTMLPLLLKTLSLAMMEWPVMRTHINPAPSSDPSAKPTLTIRPNADISIGLSTPTGLYTPTLLGLNTSSPYSIAGQLARLAYLGRQTPSGLTPAEMPKRGGTLTVSNVGAIGAGKWAVPRLVQGGGVAIVAVGRAEWVVKPSGEKRLEVGVSWSADHRIVEGAELAAFVESWRAWVENPARLIGVGK